jgi:hypothetical protein
MDYKKGIKRGSLMEMFINILIVLVLILSVMYISAKFILGVLGLQGSSGYYHESYRFKAGLKVRNKLKGWMEQ